MEFPFHLAQSYALYKRVYSTSKAFPFPKNPLAEMCSVGKKMGDPCHKLTFSRKVGSKRLDSIDCDVRELIFWRSGLSLINKDADICLHHKQLLIKRYSLAQKTCCNPFQINKKAAKGLYQAFLNSLQSSKFQSITTFIFCRNMP